MPIYEYECEQCGRIEVFQKVSDDALKECPECAKKGVNSPAKKLISASALQFNGSGFYLTDYTNYGKEGKTTSPSTSDSSSTTKAKDSSSSSTSSSTATASTSKAKAADS